MLRNLHLFCLTSLSLIASSFAIAQANEHTAIAPYLTDDVSDVAFIELDRVDVSAAIGELVRLGVVPEAEQSLAQQQAAALQQTYAALPKLRARRAYILFRISDITEGSTTWIVEVDHGGAATGAAKLLSDWAEQLRRSKSLDSMGALRDLAIPKEFTAISETIVAAGTPKQLERVRELQGKGGNGARADIIDALAGLGNADAGLAIVGDADSRRVVREMFPQLPAPFLEIDGKLLADQVRWAGVAVKFPPAFELSLAADAATPEVAQTLERAAGKGLALAKALLLKESIDGPPAHRERANSLLPLLALVSPQIEGSRLSVAFGDDEQEIAFMRNFLPAMTQKMSDESYRNTRMNHFKQIGLAMQNYHGFHKSYPPSANYGSEGKPLLSWRVHILPFLEQSKLHGQFHLDEPWDSEHNRKLIDQMPEVFSDPDPTVRAAIGDQGRTTYVVPVGESLLFGSKEGKPIKEVTDGTSNTVLAVEVVPERAVVWTKPAEWEVDLANALAGVKRSDRDGFIAGLCDGSVQYLTNDIDPAVLKKLLTPAGGEVIEAGEIR